MFIRKSGNPLGSVLVSALQDRPHKGEAKKAPAKKAEPKKAESKAKDADSEPTSDVKKSEFKSALDQPKKSDKEGDDGNDHS